MKNRYKKAQFGQICCIWLSTRKSSGKKVDLWAQRLVSFIYSTSSCVDLKELKHRGSGIIPIMFNNMVFVGGDRHFLLFVYETKGTEYVF